MAMQQVRYLESNASHFEREDWSVFPWHGNGPLFYRGFLFRNNFSAADIRSALLNSKESLERYLQKLNGQFAVVYEDQDFLFMAVDRIRSFPLHWTLENKKLCIGDSARKLTTTLNEIKVNPISLEEFHSTAYVTGQNTLVDGIYQLQAGEYLVFDKAKSNLEISSYYQYPSEGVWEKTEQELIQDLDQIHISFTENLISSLSGREVVVPLSGGYDSRLIVEMLARANYKNVTCFTYGSKNNREAQVASKLAKHLGFTWEFVEYSRSSWKEWYRSSERNRYYKFSDQLVALPHVADWPAVWELKRRNCVSENAVFVPGMSGDFLEGRHILKAAKESPRVKRGDIVEGILDAHYIHWAWRSKSPQMQLAFKEKVSSLIGMGDSFTSTEAAQASYFWEWQQRQAKYTCNSVRVYEFWGYEWRLPLWDNVMMDFWSKVPLSMQEGRKLYRRYVETFSLSKVSSSDDRNLSFRANKKMNRPLKNVVKSMGIVNLYTYGRRLYRKYFDHIGVYGAFRLSDYQRWYGFLRGIFERMFYAFRVRGWGALLTQDYVWSWRRFSEQFAQGDRKSLNRLGPTENSAQKYSLPFEQPRS